MKTVPFSKLPPEDQRRLQKTAEQLSRSLNKVTNPKTCAIVCTSTGEEYAGNNIFLSNCSLACAEANALAAAVAAGDRNILKLYLAAGRENEEPKILSPCGNCRQWLHDFARLSGNTIQVFSTTSKLEEVMITDSSELLPEGFKSAGLGRMVQGN